MSGNDSAKLRAKINAIYERERPYREECFARTLVKMERERSGSLKESLDRLRRRQGDEFADRIRTRCAEIWREQIRKPAREV